MTFGQALDAAREGKKVRPKTWGSYNQNYVAFRPKNEGGDLATHTLDGMVVGKWRIELNDWTNFPEWELWEEPGHDFKWALEQLQTGKYVARRSLIGSQRGSPNNPQIFKPDYKGFYLPTFSVADIIWAT